MEVSNLVRIEWCNEPVLTSAQTAAAYGCSTDTLKHNFQRAKEQFQEGVHYFKVKGAALRVLKESLNEGKKNHLPAFSKMASCLYLWTKQGVARHCKMINTPKAWEMFDELERAYFGVMKGEPPAEEPTLGDETERTLRRMKKQLAKPCYELAVVYVLFMSNMTVKIGYTKDLPDRIRQIQKETGLEVFDYKSTRYMTREAAAALEAQLKEKYASDCLGGEYYDVRFIDLCEEI